MAFFDKMKEAKDKAAEMAGNAAQKTKEGYEKGKQERAEKKAEAEAYDNEMKEKTASESTQMVEQVKSSFSGTCFWDGIDLNQSKSFTKDFFDKIVLPASSLAETCISMYPHIDERELKKIVKAFPEYSDSETILLHLKAKSKNEILVTDGGIYFLYQCEEDKKYTVTGKIGSEFVSDISAIHNDENCVFKVNDVDVFKISTTIIYERDFISLDNYYESIKKRDFDISDQETNDMIIEKIGPKVFDDVKRKLTYDDEILLYFSWGLDSLSAKDYIVCTNKQIIYLDREMFGATADVKQFYYEDITSMATLQNSNDSTLTGALIDTALTSALALCDLQISVAGSQLKIETLKKIEADRVVEIYHQQRKAIKEAANQPQVIVQQATAQPDALEQLEKLNKLKEAGIITEEEFAAKKADLLAKL